MSAVQTAVRFDEKEHSYSTIDGTPLIAVSRVIDAVMKKSWDGVDPEVVANAAERGQRTEDYATAIMETGCVRIPVGERQDVAERVKIFWSWYELHQPKLLEKQVIVWSERDGVAGKLDWILELPEVQSPRWLVDCKCTSQPEKAWILQIGAYLSYYPTYCARSAVLHINPSFAKGYIWREYNVQQAMDQWKTALNWYRTLQNLGAL